VVEENGMMMRRRGFNVCQVFIVNNPHAACQVPACILMNTPGGTSNTRRSDVAGYAPTSCVGAATAVCQGPPSHYPIHLSPRQSGHGHGRSASHHSTQHSTLNTHHTSQRTPCLSTITPSTLGRARVTVALPRMIPLNTDD